MKKPLILLLILNFQFSILNPLAAQQQGSVRDLAPHYGLRPEFLDDTLNLTNYLQTLSTDNHTLTDSCVSLNARLATFNLALQHDYRRHGDTLWIADNVFATDLGTYSARIAQLSAIALRRAYSYIQRETAIIDSLSQTALQLRIDTIRRNHNLIVSTCDGIGIRDKVRQKELKDIYYAYLSVYNRYDLSPNSQSGSPFPKMSAATPDDDRHMQALLDFQGFQEDLIHDLLGADNIPAQITNFANVLRTRCGRDHLDVFRSYQRVTQSSTFNLQSSIFNSQSSIFNSIPEYYDYIERLLDTRNWQQAYLTAIDLRQQMDSNSRRITTLYARHYRKAADTYHDVEATINAIPAFTNSADASTFITNLSNFVHIVQQGYIDDFTVINAIVTHGDSIVRASSLRYSDIAKAYRRLADTYLLIPTYRTTEEAYRHEESLRTFQTIQRQFDTILVLRRQIDVGRDTIAQGWSSHLAIYNGYNNIRKQFSEPPTFTGIRGGSEYIEKLQEHRAIQRHCIMAINRNLLYQGLDAQISSLIKPYRNTRKAYSTLKKHYIVRRTIIRYEDILYYEQQYIDFARVQQAILAILKSNDAAATDSRLKGLSDVRRIELILGLSN